MKRIFITFILATICGISAFAQYFSARCSSGQILYYYILSSSSRKVQVTYENATSSYYSSSYLTYPTGDLVIPSSVVYNGTTYTVTSIDNKAFWGCTGLTSVTIPNSVTSIGSSAFSGCSGLTSITIGNGITQIGGVADADDYHVFSGCSSLTRVNYTGTIAQWCGITFKGNNCNPLKYAHNLYIDNTLVTDLTIPNTVTGIKDYAFEGATCLTSVTIPNSVTGTGIGQCAFSGCSGLTSVTIPSGTGIYEGAFSGCSGLEEMTIPTGGSKTFGHIFGTSSYAGSYSVTQTYPPEAGSSSIYYDKTYYVPTSLKSVAIAEGCSSVRYGEFENCQMLTSVTIPNSVTSIGDWAFKDCSGVRNIYANPTTPPSANSNSFRHIFGTKLWVPCGSAEAYRAATGWSYFSDIRERSPYTLNVSSANLTMGTASITQQPICSNGNAIIVATPNYGYRFVQWNDGNTSNPRNITVTADVEYTASFAALPTYTITAVSADETKGIVTGGGTYYEGETATLTATANNGYWFVAWTDGSTDNPRTITVTGNATYTATFVAFHTITVRSADTNMGTVSGGGTYTEGLQVEISATPAAHHHFVQWNDGNTDNPRTITVSGDATYTASFEPDQHTVTVVPADEAMGTVSEGGTYDYGTEIQISANPAEGYGFATWNDGNTDNPRTITVTEDITYTATFGVLRTITVVSADETMGTASGSGTYTEGSQVEISATPSEDYAFVQWNDGNTDNPRTIIVTENITYTASFVNTYTIIVISANQNRGTVTGGGIYAVGSVVTIEAIAAEGFQFSSWNDNNNENPRYITVTGNATYIASFISSVQNYTISVVSANPEQGSVTGGGTYPEGTEIQISATPAEGYGFATWNDGNTDNPRTVTVVADATYIASFTSLTGIDESAVSGIVLFPNPTTDILNIKSSETISEIEIVNVMGQVVKRMEVNSDNAVCDVEDLKAGVYVVRISTAQSDTSTTLSVRKFVKE